VPSHLVCGQESFAVSLQVGFLCTAISLGPRHRQLVDVPRYQSLYIAGRCPRVPCWYGVVLLWWELCYVRLDTIYISYLLVLGHHSSFSICVPSLHGAIFFGHAVQEIQPRLVYLLGGLCRVVSYRFVDVRRFLSWVRMPIRCCMDRDSRILLGSSLFVEGSVFVHLVATSWARLQWKYVLRPCFSIRSMNSVIYFPIICIRALPPESFSCCNVDNGTLKIAPFHRNHANGVFICRTKSRGVGVGVGKICVVNHRRARRKSFT